MFYILEGVQVYPIPACLPKWLPRVHSQGVYSCFLGTFCGSLVLIWPSDLGCLRGWDGVKDFLLLWFAWRAYLNRLILAPSWALGARRWALILCAGTLDPQMH